MTATLTRARFPAVDCEIAFDNRTRQLYATDASIYQIQPAAVAFPRSAQEARAAILGAAERAFRSRHAAPAAASPAARLAMG